MHLLEEGREAFLEYLRNLTPQVLIATIALVFFNVAQQEESTCTSGIWWLLFAIFTLLGLAAAFASAIQLSRKYLESKTNFVAVAWIFFTVNSLVLGAYIAAALNVDKLLSS